MNALIKTVNEPNFSASLWESGPDGYPSGSVRSVEGTIRLPAGDPPKMESQLDLRKYTQSMSGNAVVKSIIRERGTGQYLIYFKSIGVINWP